MKTNTTKLRRALTAFVLTGAMMPISDLRAADVTLDPAQAPQSVENANVVIPEGSAATINAGEKVLLKGTGNNTLNGTGYTFTGAQQNQGAPIWGSVVSGGNWTIIGGTFSKNAAKGMDCADESYIYGGAVSGSTVILDSVNFDNNSAIAGAITSGTDAHNSIPLGGAVYGSNIEIYGTGSFSTNKVVSGNVYASSGSKYYDHAMGGAVYGHSSIVIGKEGVADSITFSGNIADATATTANVTASQGGALGGAVGSQNGNITILATEASDVIVFENNIAIGDYSRAYGGAVFTGRQGVGGKIIVKAENGGKISFKNNIAQHTGNEHIAEGGAIYTRENDVTITGAEFDNNQAISVAAAGGAVMVFKSGNLSITDSIFTNNTVKSDETAVAMGGAIYVDSDLTLSGTNIFDGNSVSESTDSRGGAIYAGNVTTISGTNTFTNNQASGTAYGGAIWGRNVTFSGDDSVATFSDNTVNSKPNDIHIQSSGSLTITDAGTYSFGSGITTGAESNVTIQNGANVTFEKGTQTDIAGILTLDGATLNIATDGTEKTKFEVGSITDKGGNTLNIDYSGTESGTVIFGDTTGLKTRPEVEYTALQDGEYGYVSSSTNKGMNVTISKTDKTYARLSTNSETAWADSVIADNLADLGTVGANDEIVVMKAPAAPTAGLTANGALSFHSNNATARTIESDGSTLVSGASDLTLNNVTLKSESADNAVVSGDSVDLTGKGTAGISAPKAIESTNGVTLDGKLTVDGAITGNTTIADDAEITVTQRTDVTGDLNVGDAKVTIDGLGMTWVDHEDKDGNVSKVPQVDRIDVTGAISFADDAVIEISFDETFNLDVPGTYEIMKGTSIVDNGAEFSFVNAIAEIDGMQMLEVSIAQNGALILNVKGFGTVPEPSTWALLVLGGLGVFGVARKNRKAKK